MTRSVVQVHISPPDFVLELALFVFDASLIDEDAFQRLNSENSSILATKSAGVDMG